MEHRKDIGELLKNRLDDAKKAPKQALWERLDASLNKRDKKRRRAAWFWYGGAGILLALLFLAGMLATPDSRNINGNAAEISTKENTLETKNDAETKIETKVDTTGNKFVLTEKGVKTNIENVTKETPLDTSSNNITAKPANGIKTVVSKTSITTAKKGVTTDGFKVTTTHEYYNSDLDTTTTSRDKQKIDSLVAANKRKMAIKDSIARKRASDSIKLNDAKKDSIPKY